MTCENCIHHTVCKKWCQAVCEKFECENLWHDNPCSDLFRAKTEWISVEERLPEKWEYVIVCDECKDVGVARHFGNGHFEWTDDENIAFATHWMPLPEPPNSP